MLNKKSKKIKTTVLYQTTAMYFLWEETSTKDGSRPTASPLKETTKNEEHRRASCHHDHRGWKERLPSTAAKELQLAEARWPSMRYWHELGHGQRQWVEGEEEARRAMEGWGGKDHEVVELLVSVRQAEYGTESAKVE